MIFPAHKCSLHLTHNDHKSCYESVEEWFEKPWMEDLKVSAEDKQKMIDTDEIWELQWYPETPVGFHKVIGPTLEDVLNKAKLVN